MRNIALVLVLLFLGLPQIFAQETEVIKVDPSFSLNYLKESDGTRVLSARAKYRKNRVWTNIVGLNVGFYHLHNGDEKLLASSITGEDGVASLSIHADYILQTNEDGFISLLARSIENAEFESAEEALEIRDLYLSMEFDTDGQLVKVYAFNLNELNEKIPVSDEDVFFYVPRMFSNLKVGEDYLEDGRAEITFPTNVIGDENGNLALIARIEEHEEFGTVEVTKEVQWGVAKSRHLQEHPSSGELWTPVAPLWMIVTLIIMLLGVWGHYLYTVVQLFLIHKEGKQIESKM